MLTEARSIADAHVGGEFVTRIATQLGSDRLTTYKARAEASKALTHLLDQYQLASGFERAPIARLIGQYRSLVLRAQFHPFFPPALALYLPSGARIDELHGRSEASGLLSPRSWPIRSAIGGKLLYSVPQEAI